MAYSYVQYTGNGATVAFSIPFQYISADYLEVRVDGVLTTAYTLPSASSVQMNVAPALDAVLEIRRNTPKTARLVDFQDASILTEASLDLSADQAFHVSQETLDDSEAALKLSTDGTFDVEGHRIKNIGDPVNAQDAATKNWSETSGAAFVGASAASASSAATSASNAAASQLAAAAEADAADLSEANAATSASNASTSATLASNWAEKGDGLDVTTAGTRSAKHHANAASASAATATTQAGNASASATAAAGSATTATTQAGNASASATAAAGSATTASTQAGIATTKAGEAATSAAAAAVSEANSSIAGKQTIWIPAGAMIPALTSGSAPGVAEIPTSLHVAKTLDFDTAAVEYAQFVIRMPKSWNEGSVSAAFLWSHAATTTNFGVRWRIQAAALGNDDTLQASWGSALGPTDTGGTTNDLYQSAESAAITPSGTPQAEDLVAFRVYRDVSDAGDTMAIDARLHGVVLFYTTDANTDA